MRKPVSKYFSLAHILLLFLCLKAAVLPVVDCNIAVGDHPPKLIWLALLQW